MSSITSQGLGNRMGKRPTPETPPTDSKRQRGASSGDPLEVDKDFLSKVPSDIGHQIFLRLGLESIRNCSLVCRSLCKITQGDTLWQKLFVRDLSSYFPEKMNSQSMHEVYKGCHYSMLNLSKGRYAMRSLQFPSLLSEHGVHSLTFTAGKICISSQINESFSSYIFDLRREAFYPIEKPVPEYISSFLVAEGTLFSAKGKGRIDIWNSETGAPLGGVQKVGEQVTSLVLTNRNFFSMSRQSLYSYDITMGDWHVISKLPLAFTKDTFYQSRLLVCGESLVVSASYLTEPRISISIAFFNLKTMYMEEPLEFPGFIIRALASSNEKLFLFLVEEDNIGKKGGTIRSFDEEKNCLRTYPVDDFKWDDFCWRSGEVFMAVDSGMLFLGLNSYFKVFDIDTGRCLSSLYGAIPKIPCGVMNSKIVFFSSRFFNDTTKRALIYDFASDHDAIFATIAEDYRYGSANGLEGKRTRADLRFQRMPEQEKNLIYQKCYDIVNPFADDFLGYGEDAFFCENDLFSHFWSDLCSTREQKARAIEAYLQERKENRSNLGAK